MPPQSKARALLVLIFALMAMVAVTYDLVSHHLMGGGAARAQAIIAGYQRQRTLDAQDAEDQDLTDDEEDAGALWARDHRPAGVDQCPRSPVAFRKGCAEYVRSLRN